MTLFDDIQKLADKNGDGKITHDDWVKLKGEVDDSTRDKMDGFEKNLSADKDGDFDMDDVKQHLTNFKDSIFGGR